MKQSTRPRKIHVVGAVVLAGAALGVGTAFAVVDSNEHPNRVEAAYSHKLNDTSEKTRMLEARAAAGRGQSATELYAQAEIARLQAAASASRAAKLNDSSEKTRMLAARRAAVRSNARELYGAAEVERLQSAATGTDCPSAADLMRAASGARILATQSPEVFEQTPRPANYEDLRLAAEWVERVPSATCEH